MRRLPFHTFLLLLATVVPRPALAQTLAEDAFRDLPPTARKEAPDSTPRMVFRPVAEVALPGPLPGSGPIWNGNSISIPVAGGTAIVKPVAGATAALIPEDVASETARETAVNTQGRRRFSALAEGSILAERSCRRCSDGWKKCWKLRVSGTTPVPPLFNDDRVFFGALDSRIYCVKARNGHRLWAVDIPARATHRLVLWNPPDASTGEDGASATTLPLVLVIPDGGSELLALSAETGVEVATLRVAPRDGQLVGAPVVTPDGHVVVARQEYEETKAALMVFAVRPLDGPPEDRSP